MVSNASEMEEIVKRYFEALFTSQGINISDNILAKIRHCIFDTYNRMLLENYTEEELLVSLKGMGPFKSLRGR